jgi:hypothetical protein
LLKLDFFLFNANAKKCTGVRVTQREATVDQLRGSSEKKISWKENSLLIVSNHVKHQQQIMDCRRTEKN